MNATEIKQTAKLIIKLSLGHRAAKPDDPMKVLETIATYHLPARFDDPHIHTYLYNITTDTEHTFTRDQNIKGYAQMQYLVFTYS